MAADASLDTNCLLRYFLGDLPEQAQAVAVLLSKKQTFQIADAAIIEAVFVLEKVYNFDRLLISSFVNAIISLKNSNCNKPLFAAVMPLYVAHPKLSINDCCLALYARFNQAEPLFTFDKSLAKALPEAELIN